MYLNGIETISSVTPLLAMTVFRAVATLRNRSEVMKLMEEGDETIYKLHESSNP